MPALKNPRHEAFAVSVANGMKGAAAYRQHVSGGKCSQRTAEVTASDLLKEGSEVALRVADLRKRSGDIAEKLFDFSRERWLARLLSLSQQAEAAQDFSAARGCLREIGRAMPGWYSPDKEEHDGKVEIVIHHQ